MNRADSPDEPSTKAIAVAAHLATLTLIGLLTGCNPNPAASHLAADQTLSFPSLVDVDSLDPAVAAGGQDVEIGQNLFDGLVKFDDSLNLVPDVAEAMPAVSPDEKTYTFRLRKDVSFSNGDRVTSKDVLYSWNRAAAMQGAYAATFAPVDGYDVVSNNQAMGSALEALLEQRDPSVTMRGLTAPDDFTVVAMLVHPAGWFLSALALADATGMILDQHAVRQDFDNWWSSPATAIGTGPFRMTSHVPKQSMDFAAVSNWWGSPKPALKSVHIDVSTSSASTAILEYEQGKFDLFGYAASVASVSDLLRIRADPHEKAQLTLRPRNQSTWVSFNLVHDASRTAAGPFLMSGGPPARDLRLAFALAVDKVQLAHVVCADLACVPATGGLITKGLRGYLGDGADPLAKFDPVKARALLREADPDGKKTSGLVYSYEPENPLNKPVAEFLQAQWLANLGVNVALNPVEHGQFVKARLSGRYVLSRDSWIADYDHPQDWFDSLWGKAAGCPDLFCATGYDTPAYDDMLMKADAESGDQALADYEKLSRLLIGDVVYIPIYYTVAALLVKPYVKGAGMNAFNDFRWTSIQIQSH